MMIVKTQITEHSITEAGLTDHVQQAAWQIDDKTTTKIAAGVILRDGAEAIIKRWLATDVTANPKVQQEMKDFFLQHGVNSVTMSEGNMGCPHEEGLDFPHGEDCPFCPFWKGKQGSNRKA
jgi:hypothetical protein